MDNKRIKGYTNAIVSAASFGLIPLFSVPVLKEGMHSSTVLIYRFSFGCFIMLVMLMLNHTRLKIHFGDFLRILFLSSLYAVSSISLIEGYKYLPSGIATTLLFSYPVWTSLISVIFLRKSLSLSMVLAIGLAVGGVAMLSGIGSQGGVRSWTGLVLELLSGFSYAVYMVAFPMLRIRRMGALKLNFFIFFFAMLIIALYTWFTEGRIASVGSYSALWHLFLLGLLPTVVSNVTLIKSLKQIDSTSVAVLGAFEPMTAMCVGIIVFGEPLTFSVVAGFALILVSMLMLILKKG